MPPIFIPFLGLLLIWLFSEFCSRAFKIKRDSFYSHFHFVSGFVVCLLFFVLTKNKLMAVILTFVTGVLWEIYEYFRFTYLPKKITVKLTKKDTKNDLIFDLLGALLAIGFLFILQF